MHETATHLTGIALVVAIAAIAGLVLIRLRQPPLVGYILAGVVLGPTGLGFVSQSGPVSVLAEMGVLVLLFIVGMELSIKAFVRVLTPASLTVLGQVAGAIALSLAAGAVLGWSWQAALVFAFIVALSSTAVAMKLLEDLGELRTLTGQLTVGIMIAQDLAVVPMLIIVESLEGGKFSASELIPRIVLALGLLGGTLYIFGKRRKFAIPGTRLLEKRRELLALIGLAACFSASAISGLLGLSPVYGAFLAGLVVGHTTLRVPILQVVEPLQNILLVVFFLSIGLLIDLDFVLANVMVVVLVAVSVIMLKTLLNVLLLRATGQPWDRAVEAGMLTAQIGEFSFVLAAAALTRGVFAKPIYDLSLSVIALSLLLSPVWMDVLRRIQRAHQRDEDLRWLASIGPRKGRRTQTDWSLRDLIRRMRARVRSGEG